MDRINRIPALTERRKEAEERSSLTGLPSFEEELWRYTPIDELEPSSYKLDSPGGALIDLGLTKGLDEQAAAIIHIVNGQIVSISTIDEAVTVHSEGAELENAIGSVVGPDFDFFADCNLAYCATPILVEVAANAVVASPI